MPTPSDASYWESAYQEGRARWDVGAAPAWEHLLALHSIAPGRTLVLGAGRGHDALWFAKRGFDVTAVDFAPSAIADAQSLARQEGVPLQTREQDLFALDPAQIGQFDLVVEHTCFCAIEPTRRAEYEDVVGRLVEPGGLFVAVFFWHLPPGGPPFATSQDEVERLFGDRFEVLRLEQNPVSLPRRAGQEGWGVLRRKA